MLFEWDKDKNQRNIEKHRISFEAAKEAFNDPKRLIYADESHSQDENRYFCVGMIDGEIVTVRFTFRDGSVRIFGAGYWRKERRIYENTYNL